MTAKEKAKSNNETGNQPCVQIDNIEGDWHAYIRALDAIDADKSRLVGEVLTAKQKCALAYLGKRAQFNGGVYNKSMPRVLSPQFINTLSVQNDTLRFKRYPWLERLIKLLAEIENMQQELAQETKVLSFARTPL